MEIISKRNRKAPYKYVPVPDFAKLNAPASLQKDKYWETETRRWKEGFNGLTGKHYFYLSQCKIKSEDGSLIRPRWRDVDMWVFEHIDECERLCWTAGVVKRRRYGLTSICAGGMPSYTAIVYPGSTSLLTSCDKPRVFAMFNDKTVPAYSNLDSYIKPKTLRSNKTKMDQYIQLGVPIMDEWGIEGEAESEVYLAETATNPTAFSSKTAKYGFYDEFPLHPERSELLGSSKACYMKGSQKTGLLIWGGTVEKGVPHSSILALQSIVQDAELAQTKIFMVEGWMGLDDFMDSEGYSNKERGTKWILDERKRLSQMADKTEYLNFFKNYPLEIGEIFEMSGETLISADVMARVQARKTYLINNKPPIHCYDLIENPLTGRVEAKLNPTGKFEIFEHPQDGVVYRFGNDTIPFNKESDGIEEKKRSKNSIWGKNVFTDTYVCRYTERSHDSYAVIKNMILLQRYYNQGKVLVERNSSGVLREKYRELGEYGLLAKEPSRFRPKSRSATAHVEVGWAKHGGNAEVGYELFIAYISEHIDKVSFMPIITAVETFLQANDDDMDAIISCEIYDDDEKRKQAKRSSINKITKQISVVTRDSYGRKVTKFIQQTVTIDENGRQIGTRGGHIGFNN